MPQWVDTTTTLQWPPPPDTPRIRYLREFNGTDEQKDKDSTQKILSWLTGDQEGRLPFVTPYGIAADGAGRIWVSDMGIHGIHQINLARNKVNYIFSAGETALVTPAGLALDLEHQRLYVSDTTLAKVFLYDLNGRYIGEWNAPDRFGRPAGLTLDNFGNLYVVDVQKNRVSIFSREGEFLRNITGSVIPELSFNSPSNVVVNDLGQIFVVDSLNFRIEVFSPTGESTGTIGSIGDGPGYFARPRGIAIDSDGHIYVADASFDNIQVFDSQGRLMIYFGKSGKKAGEFSLPAGMTFDKMNRLYVVDSFNQRLQIFEYLP